MVKMSRRGLPDKNERLYHTTISASPYITGRLSNLKQRLGPRPEDDRKKNQMRLYAFTEIIDIALDALEEKLDRENE